MRLNRTLGKFIARFIPLTVPLTAWLYRSQFSRRIATRLFLVLAIAPFVGYFRRPYVRRLYKQQLQAQNQTKQTQMNQSLSQSQIDLTSTDNNFQYMILVRSEKPLQDQQLFQKQRTLFSLNDQILQRLNENQSYFEGVKFMFLGQERIYDVLDKNLEKKDENSFDFIKKQTKKDGMGMPKQDNILLIAKQPNGDNKILMEWSFDKDMSLKAIIRQISKHKHKKYIQSMNF